VPLSRGSGVHLSGRGDGSLWVGIPRRQATGRLVDDLSTEHSRYLHFVLQEARYSWAREPSNRYVTCHNFETQGLGNYKLPLPLWRGCWGAGAPVSKSMAGQQAYKTLPARPARSWREFLASFT
jgi:hypothetical protein